MSGAGYNPFPSRENPYLQRASGSGSPSSTGFPLTYERPSPPRPDTRPFSSSFDDPLRPGPGASPPPWSASLGFTSAPGWRAAPRSASSNPRKRPSARKFEPSVNWRQTLDSPLSMRPSPPKSQPMDRSRTFRESGLPSGSKPRSPTRIRADLYRPSERGKYRKVNGDSYRPSYSSRTRSRSYSRSTSRSRSRRRRRIRSGSDSDSIRSSRSRSAVKNRLRSLSRSRSRSRSNRSRTRSRTKSRSRSPSVDSIASTRPSSPAPVAEPVAVHSVSRADITEDETALATAVTDLPVTDAAVAGLSVAELSVDDDEEFLESVPIRDDPLLIAAPAEVEPLVESPAEPSLTPSVAPSVGPLFEPSLEQSLEPNVEPVMEPSLELPVEPSPEAWTKPSGESLLEPSLGPSHEPPAEPPATFIPLPSATTSVSVVPTDPVHPAGDAVIPDDHEIPPRITPLSARPSAGVDMDAEMDAEMEVGMDAGMESDVGNAEMGIDVGDSISARHGMPTWDVQPTPRLYPRIMSGSSVSEALRLTIRMRQEAGASGLEHTNTVLMENLSLIEPTKVSDTDKQQELIVYDVQSGRVNDSCLKPRSGQRGWLESKLEQSARHLNEKVERMKVEYQELHDAWRRRHAEYATAPSIVSVNQSSANASIAPASNDVPTTGRTTRRSAATLGDSVRSDLEMEQIIASLGYDEQMDANLISTRNLAEIPDMLSVSSSGLRYLYDDTNHLVTHPHEYYAVKTGITDWTDAEKNLFLDKYALYPKQFGLIATFMENKSARQCVDYYYLHKKSLIDFRRVVVRGGGKKRNGGRKGKSNGLMTDIQQHDALIAAEERADVASSRSTTAALSDRRKPPARRGTATPAVVATPEPEVKRRRGRPPGIGKTTEWTDEDRALFAQLLQEHGENFKRIAVRMPSKTTDAVSAYFKTQYSARAKEQEDTSAIGPATPVTTAYDTVEPFS